MKVITSIISSIVLCLLTAVAIVLLFCDSDSIAILILSKPVAIGLFYAAVYLSEKINNFKYNNL